MRAVNHDDDGERAPLVVPSVNVVDGAFTLVLFVTMLASFAAIALDSGVWWQALTVVWITLGLLNQLRVNRQRAVYARGDLRVDERGVFHRGKPVVRLGDLRSVMLDPTATRPKMRLVTRWRRMIDLELASIEDARAVTAALGFDPARRPFRAATIAPGFLAMIPFVGAGLFFGEFLHRLPHGLGLTFAALSVLLAYLLTKTRFVVSPDGLTLHRPLRQPRHIALVDIADVQVTTLALVLTLKGGEVLKFGDLRMDGLDGAAQITNRLREQIAVRRQGPASPALQALSPGDEPVRAWARSLRERIDTFRQAKLRDDELWSVVDDVDAAPEKRAAAAMVLSPEIGDEGRARLRVLAGHTALPKLRVSLEAAANGDEAAAEEALEDLVQRRG